jgi:hypothetical protein
MDFRRIRDILLQKILLSRKLTACELSPPLQIFVF